jgi:threonine synthase
MNVGHPSNMARIISLYGGIMDENGIISKPPDVLAMKKDMFAVSISDKETKETIKNIYSRHQLLLEPHGAVGWAGLQHYYKDNPADDHANQLSVTLETAHPAKFYKEINDILKIDPVLPVSLEGLEKKEEKMEKMKNSYISFKEFLIKNYK